MGFWLDSCCHCNLGVDEHALFGDVGDKWSVLVSILRDVKPIFDGIDKVVWCRNVEGFSVKIAIGCYMIWSTKI